MGFLNRYLQREHGVSKSVLITGASSGIGRATAQAFAAAGWQVAATMRRPADAADLATHHGTLILPLDVTQPSSIDHAFTQAMDAFGRLDAVINNAGFAVDGVFECMDDETIRRQFDVNVFGMMRASRRAITLFRQQRAGTLVQVASVGGRLTFPLYSIYHGTKWAVEGFSESLAYELRPFNIRVKIIEPGPINTEFYGRNRERIAAACDPSYDSLVETCETISQAAGAGGATADVVATTILRATTDTSWRLRYPVGPPAPLMLALRKWLPEGWLNALIRRRYRIP